MTAPVQYSRKDAQGNELKFVRAPVAVVAWWLLRCASSTGRPPLQARRVKQDPRVYVCREVPVDRSMTAEERAGAALRMEESVVWDNRFRVSARRIRTTSEQEPFFQTFRVHRFNRRDFDLLFERHPEVKANLSKMPQAVWSGLPIICKVCAWVASRGCWPCFAETSLRSWLVQSLLSCFAGSTVLLLGQLGFLSGWVVPGELAELVECCPLTLWLSGSQCWRGVSASWPLA